jgi:hypothetical protein
VSSPFSVKPKLDMTLPKNNYIFLEKIKILTILYKVAQLMTGSHKIGQTKKNYIFLTIFTFRCLYNRSILQVNNFL